MANLYANHKIRDLRRKPKTQWRHIAVCDGQMTNVTAQPSKLNKVVLQKRDQ